MLAGLLLASIVCAVLATVLVLVPLPTRFGGGAWLWTRRFALAIIGTVVMLAIGGGVLRLDHYKLSSVEVITAVLLVVSLAWLPFTRRWNARAHLCWSMNVALFAFYLAFMFEWTLESPLGLPGRIGAFVLLALEAFAAVLSCAYLWELCDALGREHWVRRSDAGLHEAHVGKVRHPFVSLHVPCYEEPPEMVIETLTSVKALDYDNYEIVAIDDNTRDEALWRPVEAWCAANGVKFVHLQDWPGYKSGALNYALKEVTDPRAEVIGVIDSDYQIAPDFLLRCAPLFNDPKVGFIQTPQDYREWQNAPFFRQLYYSYKYFFSVSQPSRNERDGAIFAGTMGLIRREALEELGWDEWCITEDAELSLRLLRGGWSGMHVDASYGQGLMPLSFEAFKGQRFRWCFGGIQILRMHWRSMLPGRVSAENRLTNAQRWAYLSGALQWYGDLIALIFYFFLLEGAVNVALGGGLLFRKLTPFLLAAIPVLVILGFIRATALIRRGTGATWRDAIGAFFIWQSTSLVVARASVQALFAKKAEFLRTPKTNDDASVLDAFRRNRAETFLAFIGLVGVVLALTHPASLSGPLLAVLLFLPALGYAYAPINSLAARRATLPPTLEARREAEDRRAAYVRRSAAAVAGVGVAVASAAVVMALMNSGGHDVPGPRLGPGRNQAEPGYGPPPSAPASPASGSGSTGSGPSSSGGATPSSGSSPTQGNGGSTGQGSTGPGTTGQGSTGSQPSAPTTSSRATSAPSSGPASSAAASPSAAAAPSSAPGGSASPAAAAAAAGAPSSTAAASPSTSGASASPTP
jgi:cellulose synthase/poly-beta-1,6-N-acetylglucosamine synthase-like glycosyltransferase